MERDSGVCQRSCALKIFVSHYLHEISLLFLKDRFLRLAQAINDVFENSQIEPLSQIENQILSDS